MLNAICQHRKCTWAQLFSQIPPYTLDLANPVRGRPRRNLIGRHGLASAYACPWLAERHACWWPPCRDALDAISFHTETSHEPPDYLVIFIAIVNRFQVDFTRPNLPTFLTPPYPYTKTLLVSETFFKILT